MGNLYIYKNYIRYVDIVVPFRFLDDAKSNNIQMMLNLFIIESISNNQQLSNIYQINTEAYQRHTFKKKIVLSLRYNANLCVNDKTDVCFITHMFALFRKGLIITQLFTIFRKCLRYNAKVYGISQFNVCVKTQRFERKKNVWR